LKERERSLLNVLEGKSSPEQALSTALKRSAREDLGEVKKKLKQYL